MAEIIKSSEMPERMPHRNSKMKYPWKDLKPGEGFMFTSNVQPQSARVMASGWGKSLSVDFYVFLGVDGRLYCKRVESVRDKSRISGLPKDENGHFIHPEVPIQSAMTMPAVIEGSIVGQSVKTEGGADILPQPNDPWDDPDPDVPIGAQHPREGIVEDDDDLEI